MRKANLVYVVCAYARGIPFVEKATTHLTPFNYVVICCVVCIYLSGGALAANKRHVLKQPRHHLVGGSLLLLRVHV